MATVRKILTIVLFVLMLIVMAIGLASCDNASYNQTYENTGEVIKITHIFDYNSQWSLHEADEIRIFIKKLNKDDNTTY